MHRLRDGKRHHVQPIQFTDDIARVGVNYFSTEGACHEDKRKRSSQNLGANPRFFS